MKSKRKTTPEADAPKIKVDSSKWESPFLTKGFSMLCYELEEIFFHFYRINFLTDSTDFKKPCERKAKNTFAYVCKICIYAKFAYMQITSMCTGF